jgi:hypothetical protein
MPSPKSDVTRLVAALRKRYTGARVQQGCTHVDAGAAAMLERAARLARRIDEGTALLASGRLLTRARRRQ